MSVAMYTPSLDCSAMSEYNLAVTYTTLRRLLVEIKRDPEQFRTYVRIGMRDGKNAALYMDDQYLETVGLTPRDINFVAETLANQLGHFINGSTKNKTY
jgi:hypothetical protein